MNDAPLKKLNELSGVAFDGRRRGYVPPSRLNISAKLKLHKKARKDLDPVTFEVVRHALWNVNEEHGATIQRLSGSPVAMYALDLNPSILTEDAEFVYFGPYMQYMSGVTDTQVKWTLENRSDNPGIRDGDMFLANDPWVGAAHQMDVMLLCPVFWKGELFCWVTNCLHQYRHRRHHAGELLPVGARRLRRGHSHPARENRGSERDQAGHRGRVFEKLAKTFRRGARLPRAARGQHDCARPDPFAHLPLRRGNGEGGHEEDPR